MTEPSVDLEYAINRLEASCAASEGNARNIYGDACDGIATASPSHLRTIIADWRKRGERIAELERGAAVEFVVTITPGGGGGSGDTAAVAAITLQQPPA